LLLWLSLEIDQDHFFVENDNPTILHVNIYISVIYFLVLLLFTSVRTPLLVVFFLFFGSLLHFC